MAASINSTTGGFYIDFNDQTPSDGCKTRKIHAVSLRSVDKMSDNAARLSIFGEDGYKFSQSGIAGTMLMSTVDGQPVNDDAELLAALELLIY